MVDFDKRLEESLEIKKAKRDFHRQKMKVDFALMADETRKRITRDKLIALLVGVVFTVFMFLSIRFIDPNYNLMSQWNKKIKTVSRRTFNSEVESSENIQNPELKGINIFKYNDTFLIMMPMDKKPKRLSWETTILIMINEMSNHYDCVLVGNIFRSLRGEVHYAGFKGENPTDLNILVEKLKSKGLVKCAFLGNNPDDITLPQPFIFQTHGRMSFNEREYKSFIFRKGIQFNIKDEANLNVNVYFPDSGEIPSIEGFSFSK